MKRRCSKASDGGNDPDDSRGVYEELFVNRMNDMPLELIKKVKGMALEGIFMGYEDVDEVNGLYRGYAGVLTKSLVHPSQLEARKRKVVLNYDNCLGSHTIGKDVLVGTTVGGGKAKMKTLRDLYECMLPFESQSKMVHSLLVALKEPVQEFAEWGEVSLSELFIQKLNERTIVIRQLVDEPHLVEISRWDTERARWKSSKARPEVAIPLILEEIRKDVEEQRASISPLMRYIAGIFPVDGEGLGLDAQGALPGDVAEMKRLGQLSPDTVFPVFHCGSPNRITLVLLAAIKECRRNIFVAARPTIPSHEVVLVEQVYAGGAEPYKPPPLWTGLVSFLKGEQMPELRKVGVGNPDNEINALLRAHGHDDFVVSQEDFDIREIMSTAMSTNRTTATGSKSGASFLLLLTNGKLCLKGVVSCGQGHNTYPFLMTSYGKVYIIYQAIDRIVCRQYLLIQACFHFVLAMIESESLQPWNESPELWDSWRRSQLPRPFSIERFIGQTMGLRELFELNTQSIPRSKLSLETTYPPTGGRRKMQTHSRSKKSKKSKNVGPSFITLSDSIKGYKVNFPTLCYSDLVDDNMLWQWIENFQDEKGGDGDQDMLPGHPSVKPKVIKSFVDAMLAKKDPEKVAFELASHDIKGLAGRRFSRDMIQEGLEYVYSRLACQPEATPDDHVMVTSEELVSRKGMVLECDVLELLTFSLFKLRGNFSNDREMVCKIAQVQGPDLGSALKYFKVREIAHKEGLPLDDQSRFNENFKDVVEVVRLLNKLELSTELSFCKNLPDFIEAIFPPCEVTSGNHRILFKFLNEKAEMEVDSEQEAVIQIITILLDPARLANESLKSRLLLKKYPPRNPPQVASQNIFAEHFIYPKEEYALLEMVLAANLVVNMRFSYIRFSIRYTPFSQQYADIRENFGYDRAASVTQAWSALGKKLFKFGSEKFILQHSNKSAHSRENACARKILALHHLEQLYLRGHVDIDFYSQVREVMTDIGEDNPDTINQQEGSTRISYRTMAQAYVRVKGLAQTLLMSDCMSEDEFRSNPVVQAKFAEQGYSFERLNVWYMDEVKLTRSCLDV